MHPENLTKKIYIGNDVFSWEPALASEKPMRHHRLNLTYTASGYGDRIPTPWTVRYMKRERRIYSTVYGNSGSCWIIANGKRIHVH